MSVLLNAVAREGGREGGGVYGAQLRRTVGAVKYAVRYVCLINRQGVGHCQLYYHSGHLGSRAGCGEEEVEEMLVKGKACRRDAPVPLRLQASNHILLHLFLPCTYVPPCSRSAFAFIYLKTRSEKIHNANTKSNKGQNVHKAKLLANIRLIKAAVMRGLKRFKTQLETRVITLTILPGSRC